MLLVAKHKKNNQGRSKWSLQTGTVYDLGSIFAYFQTLSDRRKRRGVRYALALILMWIVLAKICGENHPSGIAEWAGNRTEMLVDLLKLKRKKMPPHSTYRRILAEGVNVEELEAMSSAYLTG